MSLVPLPASRMTSGVAAISASDSGRRRRAHGWPGAVTTSISSSRRCAVTRSAGRCGVSMKPSRTLTSLTSSMTPVELATVSSTTVGV